MQRRGISADIVTNPSTSARNSDLVDGDSEIKSHNVDHFKHRPSSIQDYSLTVSARDLMLQCNDRNTNQIFDLDAIHVPINKSSSSEGILHNACMSIDSPKLMGTHLDLTVQKLQSDEKLCPSHSMTDYGKYPSPANSTDNDVDENSLPTRVSSASVGRLSTHLSVNDPVVPLHCEDHKLLTPPKDLSSQSPPSLCKEAVRQYSYVDSLVDVATLITNTLWPCTSDASTSERHGGIRMIGHFITETSRKSKTSLSTMQLALLYCIRFKRDQNNLSRAILELEIRNGKSVSGFVPAVGSTCARRNFLSALILASKYLQDQNFSNKAWSKISSVSVSEINLREREFLEITRWNLDVKFDVFKNWSTTMESFICQVRDNTIFGGLDICHGKWSAVVRRLMLVSDSQMSVIMGQIASSASTILFNEQLETPAATPIVELLDFVLPTGESSVVTTDSTARTTDEVMDGSSMSESCFCPFFEEFIQCTPAETTLHTAHVGPEGNYATPESLRTASPALTEDDSTREHVHIETPDIEPSSVPPTPKVILHGSFSLLAGEDLSSTGACKKRKLDSEGLESCNGFIGTEGSIASRRRDGKARKRAM